MIKVQSCGRRFRLVVFSCALALFGIGFGRMAQAIPLLQIYIEGAAYDTNSQSWEIDISSGSTIRLWAIGNINGAGGKGAIHNVKLAVAYSAADNPTVSLTSSITGGYGGFTDSSVPTTPTLLQTATDGSIPKLSGGSTLPSHGEYGVGTAWKECLLGDFNSPDSPSGDFINSLPVATGSNLFQINVYEIAVAGTGTVHFDLYDSIQAGNNAKAVFAPFSHDGEADFSVPDNGSTILLLGVCTGLLVLANAKLGFRKA